jgi:hypothetical protein
VRAERRHSEWSVERVTGIVIAGRERDPVVLRALAALPELAAEWRARVVQLAG